MRRDVHTEAYNGTATDCLTTSVRSQDQTAILDSGQQQGVQTAACDQTEKFDSVSREVDVDCGPQDGVSACEILNIHSGKYTQIHYIFCRVKIKLHKNISNT